MQFSMILLHLAGAALLLLYAVHLVRTGVERAYGGVLRIFLGGAKGGVIGSAASGMAMAVMLQGSTAVAMLACGFAASGLLAAANGLALLLGADLGSALVVRILSFNLGWLIPVCILVGGILHLKVPGQKARETGRIILGIGFVLLSLKLIGETTGPLREAAFLPAISGYLARDFATAFLLGILFTWAIHSSVAAVLMLAAFATHGLVPLEAGVPMMLGANVGSGLIAFGLSRGLDRKAQRLPLGNLLFRLGGALAALFAVEGIGLPLQSFGSHAGAALVNLHVIFNASLLILCLPLAGPMAKLTMQMLPEPASTDGAPDQKRSVLDAAVVGTPRLALASVTRELLRMGELIQRMYAPIMDLYQNGGKDQIARLRKIDQDVNDAHTGIKLYVAQVNAGGLSLDEAQRGIELTDVAINLEHVGDIIAKTLLVLAEERATMKLRFSGEGWEELRALHERVMENLQLALNVLISNDVASARQLVAEKEHVRAMERDSHERHLRRLQAGKVESIETSDLHLETLRALKEINSLLVTVAYPLLTQTGDLLSSRLARSA
ncbi:MAG TPA: Na/Pi cotransporter family protein [Albidovulum sp.]|uniref:Na/Pi cotransporter family protein n=1 Tax=Albidovulum sp. TaxID=1872424 RepID=UPI002CF0CC4A|nr:Na/Pi cotransporter family protein [Albidovulum sp.]